jgi:two-component system sensor histidine kinase DesK
MAGDAGNRLLSGQAEGNVTGRDDSPGAYEELLGRPWVGLAYLVFVFLPLLFWPERPAISVWLSVAAVVIFLPMYFSFFRWRGARQRLLVPAMALLGLGVIWYNPGGNTFIIYAMAMAATVLPVRSAVLAALAMVVAMSLLFWWRMPTLALAVAYSAMVIVIGVLVMAGILYSRARSRRNAELRLTQDEVARLAAMAERERIGRDLHDLLGHTLSVVALKSELAGRLVDRDPAGAKAQIAEVETVARQALSQVREAVAGIRAAGLQAELAAARLALLSADVRLDQRLAPVAVAAEAESALAMAVREAVTNVLRHADASRVDVELGTFDGELRLSISDDGRGGATTPGTGLSGMRERLAAVGGRLEIDSPEGEGTRLLITLPRTVIAGPAP